MNYLNNRILELRITNDFGLIQNSLSEYSIILNSFLHKLLVHHPPPVGDVVGAGFLVILV